MLMYLRHAIEAEPSLNNPQTFSEQKLDEALYHARYCACAKSDDGGGDYRWSAADSVGNRCRVRGDERIAAPMIGGMITAPLLSLFIIPAAYKLMWLHRHRVRK